MVDIYDLYRYFEIRARL